MFINSSNIMLINTMMIGVIMVMSSDNWMSMWIGLEMCLMTFIPLMQSDNQVSAEAMIKYFIVQSAASSLLLFSIILVMLVGDNMTTLMIMPISMMMKLGLAPFHSWVVMVIEPLNIYSMVIMLTILKLPPMSILHMMESNYLVIPVAMSLIIGSLLALNQTSVKKTLAYSSIYNMGMMVSAINKIGMVMTSMIIYSTILTMLAYTMKMMKISFINQMLMNKTNLWLKTLIWMNMLSMAGFPPLMGFINKLMVTQLMVSSKQFVLTGILILTSMVSMFFYTRMAFSSIMSQTNMSKLMMMMSQPKMFMMTLNLTTMPIMMEVLSLT